MKRISIPLIWAIAFFLTGSVFAQNQTYNTCGGLVQIKATDGSLGYKWDAAPGLLSPNAQTTFISNPPTGTNIYTVRSKVTDGTNLVTNGDFELGNAGFTSEYNYFLLGSASQINQGQYSITNNAKLYNIGFGECGDHPGTGQMLIADGASGNGVAKRAIVWKQTITVEKNTDYIFSTWMTNVATNGVSSSLSFSINGVVIGTPPPTSTQICKWDQFYVTWNSGASETAVISIAEQTGEPGGNDFALDDISFNKVKEIVETVKVVVGPPTVVPIIIGDNSLCPSSTLELKGSIGGGKWTSSNVAVATIDATGKVTGKTIGTTDIIYTLGAASCGTAASVPFKVTVASSATAPTITGSSSLCLAGNVTSNGRDVALPHKPIIE